MGIDLLSQGEKVCSFDCLYCQLGKTKALRTKRKLYVPTKKVIQEIKALPGVQIDYITFSGRGDPTLAKNLGEVIKAIKKLRKEPIAVLTNSSLIYKKEVRAELALADLVAFKLDADSEKLLELINRPAKEIKFNNILKGIRQFRKTYRGKLALQIMLMQENKETVKNIAKLAKTIQADEIQLCAPVRPAQVLPLSRRTISALKRHFRGMKAISLYDVKRKKIRPINTKDTNLRRSNALNGG